MKEKYENLEKVIFFVLLCLLLVAMPVLLKKRAASNDILEKKIKSLSINNSESVETGNEYTNTEKYLRVQEQANRTLSSLTSKRNIFSEPVYKKNAEIVTGEHQVLQVSEIGFKPLEIEYRGKVFFKDDNDMVAQVNILKKSYLVKKGTKFASYQVDELNEKFIKLTDKKGEVIKIEYRQKVYTNELVAKIKELTSAYSETVSKNGSFLEYKVLDIDEDSVLLSHQGQHLRLEKGMVYK
ncbi:MAG: hypothetical protein V1739_03375 [Candidatus Omnitrophota bacterium]